MRLFLAAVSINGLIHGFCVFQVSPRSAGVYRVEGHGESEWSHQCSGNTRGKISMHLFFNMMHSIFSNYSRSGTIK